VNANPRDLGKEALLVRRSRPAPDTFAVIGASSAAAREQARKALVKVNTAAVLHVSAAGVEEQSQSIEPQRSFRLPVRSAAISWLRFSIRRAPCKGPR
jgi:hypothetical protein